VIRQQGLQAWIGLAVTQPAGLLQTASLKTPATSVALFGSCATATIESSPLICLCTDMLLSKLASHTPQELR